MSDRPMPKIPEGVLTEEQIAKINGGLCSPEDVSGIIDGLKENYDTLVDFTSYVMERVLSQ
jgi:hypothetical protein